MAVISSIVRRDVYKRQLFVVNAAEEGKLAVENASELIIRYLDAVNPSTLGREEFEYIDQQGNRRAKAPDREIWYAARAKALRKLQRYGECMACCDEALREMCIRDRYGQGL